MTVNAITDAVLSQKTFTRPSDLALDKVKWDISLDDQGDILTRDFFDTAILMSLFCEKRANKSEVPSQRSRRGWIGNESSATEGFEIGSKNWLYEQDRKTQTTLNKITSSSQDGLQWLIDDGFAIDIQVDTRFVGEVVTLFIIIFRPNSQVEERFYELWQDSGMTENTWD